MSETLWYRSADQELTPVVKIGGFWFKREDLYAPLGPGGINGSKLRQLDYLVFKQMQNAPETAGIISGASVKSPQLSMSAAVARRYGLECVCVIGATRPETAIKHPNVAIAAHLGARFEICKVAYNPALQRRVRDMLDLPAFEKFWWLPYGIGTPESSQPRDVARFHAVGAAQVKNLPPEIETLIIPSGSMNSTASILYGLGTHCPAFLKRVLLVGIGPNRLSWLWERLEQIERGSGVPLRARFIPSYAHSPGLQKRHREQGAGTQKTGSTVELHHFDLHGTGWVSYEDEMPYSWHGLELHPTYEGKVMHYMASKFPALLDDKACFWIVGSKPDPRAMVRAYASKLGNALPSRIELVA